MALHISLPVIAFAAGAHAIPIATAPTTAIVDTFTVNGYDGS
jgi:hypothetical protein